MPRTCVSTSKTRSRVRPNCCSSRAAARAPGSDDDPEQQVLGADVLVLQALRLAARGVHDGAEARREGRAVRRRRPSAASPARRGRPAEPRGSTSGLAEQGRDDAVPLIDQGDEQVLGFQLRVARLFRVLLCAEDGFLGLLGELVQVHGRSVAIGARGAPRPTSRRGRGRARCALRVAVHSPPGAPAPRSAGAARSVSAFGSSMSIVA